MNIKALKQKKADIAAAMKATSEKLGASDLTTEKRADLKAEFKRLEADRDENDDDLRIAMSAQDAERSVQAFRPDQDEEAARIAAAAAARAGAQGQQQAEGFSTFGARLQAVRQAALPGGRVDPRLLVIAPGMNETTPSDGGFLVGQDQVTTVRQRMFEQGQLLSRVSQLPIGANSNGVKLMFLDDSSRANGSRYGGITSYWLDEGGIKTASKPSFRPAELNLKKVAALVRVTDELLQDSVALEAWIRKYLPLELKFRAEDAIVSGTGAGMPLGFLNSGATLALTRNTPGTVTYEDIVAMWSRMWAPLRMSPGAAWFVDQSVEPALFSMSMQVGAGGVPVFLPANGLSGKPYSTLFGLPIIPVEYLSPLGTKGDIILGDLSQYTLIDKGDVQSASSIHVYFVTDETAFRFVYRVDGQPEWDKPLTPKNGGNSLAAFVTLAT